MTPPKLSPRIPTWVCGCGITWHGPGQCNVCFVGVWEEPTPEAKFHDEQGLMTPLGVLEEIHRWGQNNRYSGGVWDDIVRVLQREGILDNEGK